MLEAITSTTLSNLDLSKVLAIGSLRRLDPRREFLGFLMTAMGERFSFFEIPDRIIVFRSNRRMCLWP
jgi:hypothetical protein